MIKLVASDMDGTLLDGEGNVPSETFDLIKRLKTAGIGFVASSGRRFDTLQELFAPVSSEMDFVASNGAQVVVAGQLVDREVFSHAALRRLKNVTDLFDGLHLVVFDRKISYLLDDEERFERELDKNLPNPLRVRYILEREMGEDFVFAPSGRKWIDVMQRGVSKATGIKQVMEARHARAEEVVAFGDSMNDYEIMRMVGTSIAMGNGRSAIKEISTKVIGPNTEQAVQRELEALLSMMGK